MVDKKLEEKYLRKMREAGANNDTEVAHSDADELLTELLEDLGYKRVVSVYRKIKKWYCVRS